MIVRGTVLAALLTAEVAVLGLCVLAVRGGPPVRAFEPPNALRTAPVPHRVFDAGAHPALTVDIGYADLTILPGRASQIEVTVSSPRSDGFFQATGAISSRADGDTVRISKADSHDWSMGDDRMVTVLVPPDTRVRVLNAGDIRATGLRAEASLNSIGRGFIVVDDYAAPALHVTTSNGRIELNQVVAARLDATGNDGRVEGNALQVRDGNVQSDGRVTLEFATGTDTRVTAETSNGKINLAGFTDDSVSTSGHAGDDTDDESSARTVRLGAGDGHLTVHSSDGNITLVRNG